MLMAAVGGIWLLAQKQHLGLLLVLGAIIPPLGLMIISPFHYTANRYAFISLTSWLLLAAVGVQVLIGRVSRRQLWPVLVILSLLLVDLVTEDLFYFTINQGNRDNWKEAFAYIQEHRGPGERVLSNHEPLASYYMGEQTLPLAHVPWPDAIVEAQQPVWIVRDMTMDLDLPAQRAWIEANTRLMAVMDNHLYGRNFIMRVYYFDGGP
jgi:hypothetical protein